MKTVNYKNYTVTILDSGTVEATRNGHIASPTKPLLRDIAKELDITLENSSGEFTTRQLGTLIVKDIEAKQLNQSRQVEGLTIVNNPLDIQSNKDGIHISFMNAIKKSINNTPLTPQEIREEIRKNYPYLYGTESHHTNVDKGHYQHIDHAVLAQIYSQTKDNKDFLIDKSTKPLTISLNNYIKSDTSTIQELIAYYFNRNEHGVFYLNKGEKIEKVLAENHVPNQYGVYIIYSVRGNQEDIVYIGKAGTMTNDGTFKSQGIKNRLKAVGANNISRGIYFQNIIEEFSFDKLKFVWIITFDEHIKEIPGYSEIRLIQSYYNHHNKLPLLNKGI